VLVDVPTFETNSNGTALYYGSAMGADALQWATEQKLGLQFWCSKIRKSLGLARSKSIPVVQCAQHEQTQR